MGLRSGDLHIYKNDINTKNYIRILKISEHKSGINSLFEIYGFNNLVDKIEGNIVTMSGGQKYIIVNNGDIKQIKS